MSKTYDLKEKSDSFEATAKKDRYPTVYISKDIGCDIGDEVILKGEVVGVNKSEDRDSVTVEVKSLVKDKGKKENQMGKVIDKILESK